MMSILLSAALAAATPPPYVITDPRPLSDYYGKWSSVQFMGVTFEIKGNQAVVVAPSAGRAFLPGDVAMKNIGSTSVAYNNGRIPYDYQLFNADCLLRDSAVTGQKIYKPCRIVIQTNTDRGARDPRKFIVQVKDDGPTKPTFAEIYGILHGYHYPVKK